MKSKWKIGFLVLFGVSIFNFLNAQSTTQTEYLYMKNGYKETIAKGLDIKKGYTTDVKEATTFPDKSEVQIVELRREKDNTLAGTIVVIKRELLLSTSLNYYAIPAPSTNVKQSYGWQLFYTDIDRAGETETKLILKYIATQYSFNLGQ